MLYLAIMVLLPNRVAVTGMIVPCAVSHPIAPLIPLPPCREGIRSGFLAIILTHLPVSPHTFAMPQTLVCVGAMRTGRCLTKTLPTREE